MKNFNLTIEYFEELILEHKIDVNFSQKPHDVINSQITGAKCYAELNDTQKIVVDREKYYYYSFDDLKSIIPDIKIYDQFDMKRIDYLATLSKETSRNQDQVSIYFQLIILICMLFLFF